MERNFPPWEVYLRTAFRVDQHMVNNQLCGCDLLQCYSCIDRNIVNGNLAAGRLRSFIQSWRPWDNRPTRTYHPGPVGWRGTRNGSKKILNTCDFESLEKLIVFGRSHALISNSLLWKFFSALSSFGKRNLPLLTDEEVAQNRKAGVPSDIHMDTSLSSSSRFALAKLRRDAAGGTKDEGELQYCRGWIDSEPQPARKRKDELVTMMKSAGGHINDGDAASGHLMIGLFGTAGTSLESAPLQELLFLVLGNSVYPFESGPKYNVGQDDSVYGPGWRRRKAQLSYFYVRQSGAVPAVQAADQARMITRSMAAKQKKRDEKIVRTQRLKLEKGCVCVAE